MIAAVGECRRAVARRDDGERTRPEARAVGRLGRVEDPLGIDRRDRGRRSGPHGELPVVAHVKDAGARAERHLDAGVAERYRPASRDDRVLPDAQEEQRALQRVVVERGRDDECPLVRVVRRRAGGDDARRRRDVVARGELGRRLQHLDRLVLRGLVIRVDGSALERQRRRATGVVDRCLREPVEEVRVVEAPDERRRALAIDGCDLDADQLVLRAEVAALRDRVARRRRGGGPARRRPGARDADSSRIVAGSNAEPSSAQLCSDAASAPAQSAWSVGPTTTRCTMRRRSRRVGAAERDVEQRWILDRARPPARAGRARPPRRPAVGTAADRSERVARSVDPVGLVRVVEVGVEHHALAAHVHRPVAGSSRSPEPSTVMR